MTDKITPSAPAHSCSTCKHSKLAIYEAPCCSCGVGGTNWAPAGPVAALAAATPAPAPAAVVIEPVLKQPGNAANPLISNGIAVVSEDRIDVLAHPAPAVPDVLFDGYAVLKALTEQATRRTSPENVSDVLDAVVRLLRATPAPVAAQPDISALAMRVIVAAREAMDNSFEAGNQEADISIPSHLAAVLSSALDELDAAPQAPAQCPECIEQARLLGMGAEREAALQAQVEQLTRAGGTAPEMADVPRRREEPAEPLERFCPGCGSVGAVPDKFRDCCPDGGHARMIPASLAKHCRDLFKLALSNALADAAAPQTAAEARWCSHCGETTVPGLCRAPRRRDWEQAKLDDEYRKGFIAGQIDMRDRDQAPGMAQPNADVAQELDRLRTAARLVAESSPEMLLVAVDALRDHLGLPQGPLPFEV